MADLQNHNFFECFNPTIGLALGTQIGSQLDSGANSGLWVSMRDYYKVIAFVITTGGTTADDLVFTINQATSNGGAGSKVAACVTSWFMVQATTLGQATSNVYTGTKPTGTPASTFTATGSAGKQSLIGFEIVPDYLDATDGFYFVQTVITQTADSAYGAMLYLPVSRHPQGGIGGLPVNPLA